MPQRSRSLLFTAPFDNAFNRGSAISRRSVLGTHPVKSCKDFPSRSATILGSGRPIWPKTNLAPGYVQHIKNNNAPFIDDLMLGMSKTQDSRIMPDCEEVKRELVKSFEENMNKALLGYTAVRKLEQPEKSARRLGRYGNRGELRRSERLASRKWLSRSEWEHNSRSETGTACWLSTGHRLPRQVRVHTSDDKV